MRSLFDVPQPSIMGCGIRRVLFSLGLAAILAAQAYAGTDLNSSVIAGGGGRSSGGNFTSFTLDGTIGQGVAGVNLSGGAFAIEGGFHHTVTPPKPAVTINQAITQADPTIQFPINFTVVFSEAVTSFTVSSISLTGGTAPGIKTITITGTGASYNVAVSGVTGAGTVIADVKADTAVGISSGLGNYPSTSTDNTVTVIVPDPPAITGIVPSVGAPGTTVNVTLTGTNLIVGATAIAPIPEVTISGISVTNSTSMIATFAVDANAALGPRSVTVTTAGGTSGAAAFTIAAPFPDLKVTSSHAGAFGVGFNETYTVEVSNAGSSASGAYTVTDVLPSGLTFVSGIGAEWSCSAAGQTATCTQPSGLSVAATSPSLTITVAVSAPAAPTVTHAVSVATAGDLVPSNDTALDATTVAPVPSPTFTFTPTTLVAGQPATMGVRIASAFPHDVTGTVTLSFTPQASLPDDPAVQFAGGGNTVTFSIPKNTLEAIFGASLVAGPVGFQPGTVAGTLNFSGILNVGAAEVPFSPGFGSGGSGGFVIAPGPPKILAISTTTEPLAPASNGQPQNKVTAQITLFSTMREVTEITLRFHTSPKVQLSCGSTQGCSANGNSMTFQVKQLFADFFATTSDGLAQLKLPLTISGTVHGAILITFGNSEGFSDVVLFDLP